MAATTAVAQAAARSRLASLIAAGVAGLLAVLAGAAWLGTLRQLPAHWQAGADREVELVVAHDALLEPHRTKALAALGRAGEAQAQLADTLVLHRSSRWLVDDTTRSRHLALHREAAASLDAPQVQLVFADGSVVQLAPAARGLAGLGAAFWMLSALAVALYLAAVAMLLARRSARNTLFALMSLCQAGNLALIAAQSCFVFAVPPWLLEHDFTLRAALDLATAAAAVNIASLYPSRWASAARAIAGLGWAMAAGLVAWLVLREPPGGWWWIQGGVAILCGLAIVLLHGSERDEPHPQATQLRRSGSVALGTWLLLTLALSWTSQDPGVQHPVADIVSTVWYVFLASMLLLVPFAAHARRVVREFALVASIATVATSLALLLVAALRLGQFAAVALSLFVGLALYGSVRTWLLEQLIGGRRLTTERMFDQLYRIAREVQAHPGRVPLMLLQLLRDLFDPLQSGSESGDAAPGTRIEAEGTELVVPIAPLGGSGEGAPTLLRLRMAQRGRRPFNRDDARLADRIVEQLRRAVAFDHAVEQGRREERLRLAQDLHDDIGARLLTLMYKAPSPEIEEYVRHTLKDLKTLTRGLAASGHRIGDAAAEWKADLMQRLTAADIELAWHFSADRDPVLGVVQWSALTRILRELVSNAIAHARATRVEVAMELAGERLSLRVADDGRGQDPERWAHGLGLGGVRKRVKQLGGDVAWQPAPGGGIECRVRLVLPAVPE